MTNDEASNTPVFEDETVLSATMQEDEAANVKSNIIDVDLRSELSKSYMDYSMAVIVSRALPDVRDGLKAVHRRVLYGMYNGGYRPEKAYAKSARIVGDVMGNFHPHGDSSIYDTMVRLAQPWSLRYPLVDGNGNFGSQGNDGAAAPRYTEARMATLANEMMRDIDEESVPFKPNYDGRIEEPKVLPSRFPNLIVNGSSGIAVGMATNIFPNNLGEANNVIQWFLKNPKSTEPELLEKVNEMMQGPDFPTGCLISGTKGIQDAYATGRGSIRMRSNVEIEETKSGRTLIVVTSIPYQANKDALLLKIKELADSGVINGISEINDESSSRAGMRLVISLQRGAVVKVVLNNLYKHTQMQTMFNANMVSLVNGEPKTLSMPKMIALWVQHQITIIENRTKFRLKKAQARQHILDGILAALDQLDEVIATIRKSPTVEDSREALKEMLSIDDIQANAILEMQLRRLAALERDKVINEHSELEAKINDYNAILNDPDRVRQIIGEELQAIVDKHDTPRMSEVVAFEGDVDNEDLIPVKDIVATITKSGYIKRTPTDAYRLQTRGGTGGKGTKLREDDLVEHFLVTTTHHTLMFFTNQGRVYRVKGYELPEGGKDAKGSHIANLVGLEDGEHIAKTLCLKTYDDSQNLILATSGGLVKKTRLEEYNSRLNGSLIAVNLKDGDELVAAELCNDDDVVTLISHNGFAVRFPANNESLRAQGRNTSGSIGMRFKSADDKVLTMLVSKADADEELFLATSAGFGKRTDIKDYSIHKRGGKGIMAMKTDEERGKIVSAAIVDDNKEMFALTTSGTIIRSNISDIRPTGRISMGVRIIKLKNNDTLQSVVINDSDDQEDEASQEASEQAGNAEN